MWKNWQPIGGFRPGGIFGKMKNHQPGAPRPTIYKWLLLQLDESKSLRKWLGCLPPPSWMKKILWDKITKSVNRKKKSCQISIFSWNVGVPFWWEALQLVHGTLAFFSPQRGLSPWLLMVQNSGDHHRLDGAKNLVNNGISTISRTNWWVYRISGCHQQ